MVTATQTCMTQLGKTTITEATVRQTKCDATDGPKVLLKSKQFLNFFFINYFSFSSCGNALKELSSLILLELELLQQDQPVLEHLLVVQDSISSIMYEL